MLALKQALSLETIKNMGGWENKYSLQFSAASSQYMKMDNGAVLSPTSAWSISFWVKDIEQNKYICGKQEASSGKYEYMIAAAKTTGYPRFRVYGNSNTGIYQQLQAHIDICDGDWHHIIFAWGGGFGPTDMEFFVDGVIYDPATGNITYNNIGTWSAATHTSALLHWATREALLTYSDCILDEISVHGVRIDQSIATAMYNGGTPTDLEAISGASLTGWWRNGDPTGTGMYPTIPDEVGSLDATMYNMASGDIITDVP